MSIQKNIGKNTIGDNNKMSVSLHEWEEEKCLYLWDDEEDGVETEKKKH